jgi:hypothetical protein
MSTPANHSHTTAFVHPNSQYVVDPNSPTGQRKLRALATRNPQAGAFGEETATEMPRGRASGPELFGAAAIFPPVMTVFDVARLLRMNFDSVRRIDRSELPYLDRGAGKWTLYLREDVLEYVRRRAHEQSHELDFKGRRQVIGEVLGSARGRSRKGTSS